MAASLDAGIADFAVMHGPLVESTILDVHGSWDKAVVNGRHPAALSKLLRQSLSTIKTCMKTTDVSELTRDYR